MTDLFHKALHGFCRLGKKPQFQVVILAAVFIKIVWGMWLWRDLTAGDTSSYFNGVMVHLQGRQTPGLLVFSPLYILFYSWFITTFQDAFVATILHRIVIIFLFSSAVWLLFKNLLPRPIAVLITLWWMALPINWNALYEVHLFGAMVLTAGCWATTWRSRTWGPAVGLSLVWSATLLVRNEYALSLAMLTSLLVLWELLKVKRGQTTLPAASRRIGIWAAAGIAVTVLSFAALRQHWTTLAEVQRFFKDRHELNIAQVYPYSYQQRHPEWKHSPWTEGYLLMDEKFGKRAMSFSEAYQRNPQEISDHIAWHMKLLPAGLQLGLFNAHQGPFSPDFTAPLQNDAWAITCSVLLLLLLGLGAYCAWKHRRFYLRLANRAALWGWIALLCTVPPCVVAIITQRPRPSYIYLLCILIMAVAGFCLMAVLRHFKLWQKFKAGLPFILVVLFACVFTTKITAQLYPGQPLLQSYHRLTPFRSYFEAREARFASSSHTSELSCYIMASGKAGNVTILPENPVDAPAFDALLNQDRVTLLYLQEKDFASPAINDWLTHQRVPKWQVLARNDLPGGRWLLLGRKPGQ